MLCISNIYLTSAYSQTTTTGSGSWSTASRWSTGSVPGAGTTTVVNHALTLDRNLSVSANYTINAPVTDPVGATNYNLTVSGGGTLDVNANVQAGGVLAMSGGLFTGTARITIRSGDTLVIGYPGSTANSNINGYSVLTIEQGGVLMVYGNLELEASGQINCNGEILIDGNFHADYAWLFVDFPSDVSGTGSITATGTITSDGNSEVFGSQDNCSSGPCSSGNPCAIVNTISSAQSVCDGATPAALTGTAPAAASFQWQKSTTSAISGYSNIIGETSGTLNFTSGISTTTWYRRLATMPSSCVSTSAPVKITVNPTALAEISISTPINTFCSGVASITFTATSSLGGSSVYQWKRTRSGTTTNVGTNSATFVNNNLTNGDIIYCVVTSNAPCVSGSPATSNSITLQIMAGAGSWSGASSSNWNTTSNWCSNVRPTTSNTVVLYGGVLNNPVVSSAAAVCNHLTLHSGALLTVNGNTLTLSGNLIINSGASLVINSGTVTVNGNITVNSGGTLAIASPGALIAKGNVTNNGVISGTGTMTLNGTVNQNLSGANGTFGNVELNNTAGCTATGVITLSGVLKLTTGQFRSNGNLTMDLNTGAIAGTGTGSVSGNITVSKYPGPKVGYHYLSSPLSGRTVNDWNDNIQIKSGSYANLYYYNETIPSTIDVVGWTAITDLATPLAPLKGYALHFEKAVAIDQTGSYVHGSVPASVSLSNTPSGDVNVDGWHLVGNPYPSALDWNAATGWTKTGVDNAVYFWDPVNEQYASYVDGSETNGGTRYIPSMQAFWVHVTASGGTGTFGINNNARITSVNPSLWRLAGTGSVLKLTASSGSHKDETLLRLREDASEAFDPEIDAYKLKNEGNTPNLYTESGKIHYSINSIPEGPAEQTIPLKLKAGFSGTYKFTAEKIETFDGGVEIIFEDRVLGVIQDLRSEPSYTAEVLQGDTASRFYITFRKSSVTSNYGTKGASEIKIIGYRNTVTVQLENAVSNRADINIFNMKGQKVYAVQGADISTGEYRMEMPENQEGIFIVKVSAGKLNGTGKVFLHP